ncbi:endopeptidase SpoIID/LytB [Salibacterium salarium]|uniref:Endopeptidase SpoIID/LytB n=1 Tax=Salibacterium salarium TaxID=284579 RepID=A0A3R9QJ31_9BACI|nr:peptidoglycan-binding protein [Salibacterium salarium]RSL31838.1 endopeptidase SpoIID/LytB [Salibacterium salarium]
MFDTTTSMKKVVVTSTAVTGAVLAGPTAADAALGDDTLYPDTQSEDVEQLQGLLKDKGHFTYHSLTGRYDEHTIEAVKSFQREHQLMVDGIAGPETFGVLLTETPKPTEKVAGTSTSEEKVTLGSSTIMRLGDESVEIEELQRQLTSLGFYNGEKHGYYGRQTKEAVKKFQTDAEIATDGIAGPQTFAALKSAQTSGSEHTFDTKPDSTFKVIESGDKGSEVSLLQRQLKDIGFYNKDVTGVFGPMTEEAVRKFQQRNQLVIDGLAGPKTLNKLKNNPEKAEASTEHTSEKETTKNKTSELRYQSSGEDVEQLQSQLRELNYMKMEATGVFGEVTENAVKAFQEDYNLSSDGVAGPRTLEALDDALNDEESGQETADEVSDTSSNQKVNATNLVADAAEHVGTPYVWGGTSESGFDCSGFLQYTFKENGVDLPRSVSDIYDAGDEVEKPRVGDIVFFETYKEGPSHAGIYTGNNQFIHSGTSTGVTVSDMNTNYWDERYLGAKRYQ